MPTCIPRLIDELRPAYPELMYDQLVLLIHLAGQYYNESVFVKHSMSRHDIDYFVAKLPNLAMTNTEYRAFYNSIKARLVHTVDTGF